MTEVILGELRVREVVNDWLAENMPQLALLLSAVTTIGVFVGPVLAERLRERHERRLSHQRRLKELVLQPQLRMMEAFVFPVLRSERANVGIVIEASPGEVTLPESWSWESKQSLAIVEPVDDPRSPGPFYFARPGREGSGISPLLLEQAPLSYPRLFKRWDRFLEHFREFGEECLHEVTIMHERLLDAADLPEHSLTIREPPWINANWLGCYAFFHARGLIDAGPPLAVEF